MFVRAYYSANFVSINFKDVGKCAGLSAGIETRPETLAYHEFYQVIRTVHGIELAFDIFENVRSVVSVEMIFTAGVAAVTTPSVGETRDDGP